jgi:predicted MPP superfamily phosphohydrolase
MAMSRRAALKVLAGTATAAIGATSGYGVVYGRHALEVTRATVPVMNLPPPLSGLRIGLLTDVHRSRWVTHDDVISAVAALMNERPDVIVLGGDYVTFGDRRFVQLSAEALDALSAPFGVYGILGNHDDDHDMPAALASRGVQMLKDARTTVTIKKGRTRRLGRNPVLDATRVDIASLCRGATGFPLLRARSSAPDRNAALRIPLVLSGHTHGGQVVLPGAGRDRGSKISGRGRHRASPRGRRCLSVGGRHRLRAHQNQLPARSRCADAAVQLIRRPRAG